MMLYVEQPFPYDLETHRIDVHSVSARKPLFMDESAHDWRLVRLGRSLGWTGVALKTCKTQTGALLSLCWAKAHGMTLMVQDLTNPMLAQIPHVLLAAHAGTIMGVETNGMQFYPDASRPEAAVHPGLYRRREGMLDLSTIQGPGFGYRVDEIRRELPEPAASRNRGPNPMSDTQTVWMILWRPRPEEPQAARPVRDRRCGPRRRPGAGDLRQGGREARPGPAQGVGAPARRPAVLHASKAMRSSPCPSSPPCPGPRIGACRLSVRTLSARCVCGGRSRGPAWRLA